MAKSSNYSQGQSWGALRSAWRGYRAALAEGNAKRLEVQKQHINSLQAQLGLKPTRFRKIKAKRSPTAGRRRLSPRPKVRRSSPRPKLRRRSPSPQLRR